MVMTSVLGHVQELDFPSEFANWQLTPPASLLSLSSTPVIKSTPEANRGIVRNLEEQARSADWLVIWTDCDREGEHIGSEIVQICQNVNRRLQVYRARYSAVTAGELRRAMAQLQRLDERQVAAVNVRSELDLRTGACFTRFQTLCLQQSFPALNKEVISYGSCQFPTLGFVVEQYLKVKRFTPEPFWFLELKVQFEGISNTFTWKRGHLFDHLITLICYERCLQDPQVLITSVSEKPCTRYKPLPLRTVEFQKAASKFLKMSSESLMTIAERLYNRGYISYPRTETDVFEFNGEELRTLVRKQGNDPQFGAYAERLLSGDFSLPRKGKNNDKAHPPIHPTSPGSDLSGPDRSVFEFIARRFLACCSLNAEGRETVVTAAVGREEFECRGVCIVARNYLDVYPYDRWSENEVAPYQRNQQLPFQSFLLQQGMTTAPPLLSEADLITCMDKNGIGTDATIHEHIHKLLLRSYARKLSNRFIPTRLGTALVAAYDALGLEVSLTQPKLRAALEGSLQEICRGVRQGPQVLQQLMNEFQGVFGRVEAEFGSRMMAKFREYLDAGGGPFDLMPMGGIAAEEDSDGVGRRRRPSGRRPGNPNDDADDDNDQNENDDNAGNTGRTRKRRAPSKRSSTTRSNNKRERSKASAPSTLPNCNCGTEAVMKTVTKAGPNTGRQFYTCSRSPTEPGKCDFFSWADGDAASTGFGSSSRNSSYNSVPNTGHNYNSVPNTGHNYNSVPNTGHNYNSFPNTGHNYNSFPNTGHNYNSATSTGHNYNSGASNPTPSNSYNNSDSKECACGLLMIRGEFKRGPSAGRSFLKCPKIVGKCGAFEFLDGGSLNDTGAHRAQPRTQPSTRAQRARPTESSKTQCYKCNGYGHWANACPQ